MASLILPRSASAGQNPAMLAHGPAMMGLFLNTILLGVMLVQCYIYFTNPKRDVLWMRFFVAILAGLDTLNTCFLFYFSYDALVLHFGDVNQVLTSTWQYSTNPVLIGTIGFMCQSFFAWRVFILTNNRHLTLSILMAALVGWGAALACAAITVLHPNFAEWNRFKPAVSLWLVPATVADVIITVSLVWYLKRHKRGFEETDRLIDKVVIATVQTGMLTSVWASIDLAVYLGDPTGLHLLFNIPLGKLYSNSLVSSLNARSRWRFGSTTGGTSSGKPQEVDFRRPPGTMTEVFVNVERYREDPDMRTQEHRPSNPFLGSTDRPKIGCTDEISLRSMGDAKSAERPV